MTPAEYRAAGHAKYDRLATVVASILAAGIKAHGKLRLQQLQYRAKSPDSLEKKLAKNDASSTTDVEDAVKDLGGCRAIFYTNTDVDAFLQSGILRDNFEIDWDRTKQHHPVPGESDSLFISVNYVVRLKDDRAALPEYAEVAGLWCEVQVQTTLNHAWSEMEHDIIYKPPRLEGFGGETMKAIKKRMRSVMRKHLIPAGYEFQKIAYDFDRLSRELELFDSGPLQAMAEAKDTNELFEIVERFGDYILPNYDDVPSVYDDVWPALVGAVRRARSLPVVEITTAWGNYAGKTDLQVETKIAEAIKDLRYLDLDRSFDDATALYDEAADDEARKLWLSVIESLAKNNLSIWRRYGAFVQNHLMKRVAQRRGEGAPVARPVALVVSTCALDTGVEASTTTYDSITFHQGAVAPGDLLREGRTLAIDCLIDLFASAADDGQRQEVLRALNAAGHLPHNANYSDGLLEIILDHGLRAVTFFKEIAVNLSYELRVNLEHDILTLHDRFRRRPATFPAALNPKADALLAAALSFRDAVNEDPEFVIYKTLVGFRSVFPDAWTGEAFDFERDRDYRAAKIAEYVADFTPDTVEVWLTRLQRCAQTESNDLAMHMEFGRFVQELAKQKPLLVLTFLPMLDGPLARFVPGFLHGLAESAESARVEPLLREWVERRVFIGEALHYLRHAAHADADLLVAEAAVAFEESDLPALLSAASAGIVHAADAAALVGGVALPAIENLSAGGAFRWIDDLAFLHHQGKLVPVLDADSRSALLRHLGTVPKISYRGEELLSVLANGEVKPVLDFFDSRFRAEDREEKSDFEPAPFSLHNLPAALRLDEAADDVIRQAYAWYEADKRLFPYRGGRLVANLYPEPIASLGEALTRFVAGAPADAVDFALHLLRSYNGQDFLLAIARELLAANDLTDGQLNELEVALTATGIVSGEFGMVEAYRHKREAVEAWGADTAANVRAFAERYRRSLDRMIASEQRRSEEEMELRKRHYGEDGAEGSEN